MGNDKPVNDSETLVINYCTWEWFFCRL